MSETKTEVAVGAGVIAVAVGFLIYAGQVTGLSAPSTGYLLTASFRSLEGVGVGTDVRLAGVKVGSVTAVNLNPETFRADTTITVLDGIILPDDSAIIISSEGLLGGNFVELMPGGSPFNLNAGDEIIDTQGAVSLVSLLMKFVSGEGQ